MSSRRVGTEWKDDEKVLIEQLKVKGLNVGAYLYEPWAYPCAFDPPPTRREDRSCSVPGIGIEFTKTLCDRLKINCRFTKLNLSEILGAESVQEPLADKIRFDDVDTELPTLMETLATRATLDFSMPVFFMEGGLMVRTEFSYSSDLMYVVKPFQSSVWALLLCSLAVVAFLDSVCRISMSKPIRKWFSRPFWTIYQHSFLIQLGLLLQRGESVYTQQIPRRILLFFWGVTSITVCGIYAAFLVSHRVAAKINFPFTDLYGLSDAINSRGYTLLIDKFSSNFIDTIQNSPQGMFEVLNKSLEKKPPIIISNLSGITDRIINSKQNLVLYSSQYSLKARAKGNCNVTIIPLTITDMGGYAFRKTNNGSARLFTKLILNFKEKGYYIEHLEQKYRFGRNCETNLRSGGITEESSHVEVTVHSLQVVFLFLVIGAGTGTLALTWESLYHRTLAKPTVRALALKGLGLTNAVRQDATDVSIFWNKAYRNQFYNYWVYGNSLLTHNQKHHDSIYTFTTPRRRSY